MCGGSIECIVWGRDNVGSRRRGGGMCRGRRLPSSKVRVWGERPYFSVLCSALNAAGACEEEVLEEEDEEEE